MKASVILQIYNIYFIIFNRLRFLIGSGNLQLMLMNFFISSFDWEGL